MSHMTYEPSSIGEDSVLKTAAKTERKRHTTV